ncbi:methyl-accepting chemotaxis protein [Pseudomonas sp. K5002]|uniref:methyl-accepting chemotaxis protein n=1 Tax=Pseudomonas sp. K5002 TaxID=2738828 RepID=UPI0035567FCE
MGEALSTMVSHIRKAAEDVNSRAQALSGLSGGAYEGMEQQSGEITSMAGAVEEFSATSLNIADNMGNTERLAQDNAQQTRIGRTSMQEASSSLEHIATALNSTATVINTLGQRSQEIGGIVGVITAIAEQTNLLALNAAIEAARAGEQGRGFAVVADEVRGLAQRTQDSTNEIQRMISTLQGGARDAVQAMAQSSQHVEASVDQAQRAAAALDGISQRVTRITAMSQQIAAAVEEQSAVSEDINRNIIGIRNAGEVTVSAGQQSQLSSGDVAGLADDLRRLAEEFWGKRR